MDIVNQLFSDTVMILPGQFVTLNSHWEDWNLPNWFHAANARPSNVSISGSEKAISASTPRATTELDEVSEVPPKYQRLSSTEKEELPLFSELHAFASTV